MFKLISTLLRQVLTAFAFSLAATTVQAADLYPRGPRVMMGPKHAAPVVQKAEDCAWVQVRMHNWNRAAVFRVTAVGGSIPGGWLQMPARHTPGSNRLCIPRQLFAADIVEICIGDSSRDKSNSRLIRGRIMAKSRENITRTGWVNPGNGNEMNFRYNGNGPIGGGFNKFHRRQSSAQTSTATR